MSPSHRVEGTSRRHEQWFARMPDFGALLYDWLAGRPRTMDIHRQEVARDLASRLERGRLLDVGTGHGRLLGEIGKVNPAIDLYGLDISPAMVRRARRNLRGIHADLRQGSICSSGYQTDFFHLVTCTGSFYLWDEPAEGLREIHRILAPGASAHLFEPCADTSEEDLRRIGPVLRRETLFRRLIGPLFLRLAVRMGVRIDDTEELLDAGPFRGRYAMERTTLAGLPIWLHLTLTKS